MDVNAIMLENRKKKKGTSSITPNKVITKVSLPQEADIGETTGETIEDISKSTIDVMKLTAASNVMSKVIKIVVEEEHNMRDVDTEKTLEVEVLEEDVVKIKLWKKNLLH